MKSHLDDLPPKVQKAILETFNKAPLPEKLIFLSRIKYGNNFTYKEISEVVNVSIAWIQKIVDDMFHDIRKSPYVSGMISASGVYL